MDIRGARQFRDDKLRPGVVWEKRGKKRVILRKTNHGTIVFLEFTEDDFRVVRSTTSGFYSYLNRTCGAEQYCVLPGCLLQIFIDVFAKEN